MKSAFCWFALLVLGSALSTSAAEKLSYNRDIRPILSEHCFRCHGPDSASRKGDLRLDRREAAVRDEIIVAGKPQVSELVKRIHSNDHDEMMPPPSPRARPSAQEKTLLERWIAEGAEYEPHWSLIAPQRSTPPVVKDTKWVRTPIDQFILSKLEAAGLTPAPEADRRTLARRLSLDLTGLPPATELVERFVNDKADNAYEKLVDELMQSPRWGEHRGRYWLDAARYADTHGIHFDNFRENHAFRDWVIEAFNQNLPFDQFTIQQLAGDLLPNRTLEQQIASGFNRCNITTNEGGIIDEEYLVLYTRDRTETTAQVWLGMTAGCAVCHDHKFDPLSQKEFYQLAAFFNNTTQNAKDGNIKDTPPVVIVPQAADRAVWNSQVADLDAAKKNLDDRKPKARPEFDSWLSGATPESLAAMIPNENLALHAKLSEGQGQAVEVLLSGQSRTISASKEIPWGTGHLDPKAFTTGEGRVLEVEGAGDFDMGQAFSCGAWVKLPKGNMTGALVARMDDQHDFRGWDMWIEGGKPGSHIIHKWQDDALKVVANRPIKAGEWHHVLTSYDGSGKAAGLKIFVDGVQQDTSVQANALKSTTRTDVPLKIGQRHTTSRLDGVLIQDLRVFGRALGSDDAGRLAKMQRLVNLAGKPADKRTPAENDELFGWWLSAFDKPFQELAAKMAAVETKQFDMKARGTVAHVMNERDSAPVAFILNRGEYDQRRDQVNAQTPAALPPMPEDLPRNRLGFAEWLLRPEHPLTTRVTVNRFWQELYGNGLVRTSGDFGVMGELPSHPELLDWLAVEFRESGWDVKKFFKLLVMSAAYRQAGTMTPAKLEKDSQNRLLSRGPRFRMDAEMLRDYALSVSGLLSDKIGGPSVKPYQPPGVWEAVAMIGSNTRNYQADKGESLYRRSMYTFWKRAAPPASMDALNAPNRETCTVRRERTNTPLQALITLNDPQFVEAARKLAEITLTQTAKDEARIDFIAHRLLSRPLRSDEQAVVLAELKDLSAYYQAHEADARQLLTVGESKSDEKLNASELAAWTMLCNQLMNLDEVLNK